MSDRKKNIAIILSGCGLKDGSEIQESVLTMLAIDLQGARYTCFAPDIFQEKVVDHYHKMTVAEQRNVLVESARIARGQIQPLSSFDAKDCDALILPGGAGAISNLCSYATDGPACAVNEAVRHAIVSMRKMNKPIGALCIAPVLLARILPGITVTIGNDQKIANDIHAMGGAHHSAATTEIVVDPINRIVTTPCYMLATTISQIAEATQGLVREILKLI